MPGTATTLKDSPLWRLKSKLKAKGLSTRAPAFSVPVEKSRKPLPREALVKYWHPDRIGVEKAPASFQKQVRAVAPDVIIVRPPANAPVPGPGRSWLIWQRNERVTHPLCPGWGLVFDWRHAVTRKPLELNELVLHNLYIVDPTKYANAGEYFDRIEAEIVRMRESKARAADQDTRDRRKSMRQAHQINSAGRGNKFARYGDGTVLPSRGQLNWDAETRGQREPGEMKQRREQALDERSSAHRK